MCSRNIRHLRKCRLCLRNFDITAAKSDKAVKLLFKKCRYCIANYDINPRP